MELILRAEIPGLPPSVNRMYGGRASGRIPFKTKEVRDFQKQAGLILLAWKTPEITTWPYEGPVALAITLRPNNNRPWDLDNRVKVLQDCLNAPKKGGVNILADDSQIYRLVVTKERVPKGYPASTLVRLWAL